MKGRMLIFRSVFTFTISILGFSGISLAQTAGFQGLGDLPGGDFESSANAVSADGLTVVGRGCPTPLGFLTDYEAFRWNSQTEIQGLGYLPGQDPITNHRFSVATGVSGDGQIIVGCSSEFFSFPFGGINAYCWTLTGGCQPLADLPYPYYFDSDSHTKLAISDDGSTVVGKTANGAAFYWQFTNPEQGMGEWFLLDDLLTGSLPPSSAANDTSADGSIVVGTAAYQAIVDPRHGTQYFYQAFRWSDSNNNGQDDPGEMKALGILKEGGIIFPNFPQSIANACSSDGAVIVGWSDSDEHPQAFRWTLTDPITGEGEMIGLGILAGFTQSNALDVSADGSIVVGTNQIISHIPGRPDVETAFLWDEWDGMRDLKVVLETDYGLDLTGWVLTSANGISADGYVIVGSGINPDGNVEAWIATIPEPSCLTLLSFACLCVARRRKTLRDSENSQ